jgi:DNA-binding beta-propeller fold protein YncE
MTSFVRSFLPCAVLGLSIFSSFPANAQSDQYLGTVGIDNGQAAFGNTGFAQPVGVAIDHVANHLIVADSENNRVQIFDATSLAYVATIGSPVNLPGSDDAHLNLPGGLAVDETNRHIIVADLENNRLQVFNADNFSYVATIGSGKGTANGAFSGPFGVLADPAHNRILAADIGNGRVQIFNATTFAFQESIGTGQAISPGFIGPVNLALDPAHGTLLILDGTQNCAFAVDSQSFAPKGKVGTCQLISIVQADEGAFDFAIAVDPAKNRILLTDTPNDRILVFDAGTFAQTGTLGVADVAKADNTHFDFPGGLYSDQATGRLYIGDTLNNRVQIYGGPVATPLAAAILPGGRSVPLGHVATVFATILNAGPNSLNNCRIFLPNSAPSQISMSYQTTDPATNALTGTQNTPVTIAGTANGIVGSQTFLLAFSSQQSVQAPTEPLAFACDNATPASPLVGINTIDLSFSLAAVPDVIAIAATASGDGVLTIPFSSQGAGAFALASTNAGAGGTVTASVDTGGATLPLTATICQTVTGTGACMQAPASSISTSIAANARPTFSVFVTASQPIQESAALSRIFVRFTDSGGNPRGSTSVAVQTN